MAHLAVHGGRDLRLGRLTRLHQPAEPDLDLDQQAARRRLAAPADHARPAGLVHDAGPLPAPGTHRLAPREQLRRRPHAGPRRGRQDDRRDEQAGDRQGQHAVVRHRGVRHLQDRLPRVGQVVPQRLVQPPARARLRLGRLLQRRLRDQDARRRPGQHAGQVRAARPALDRRLERQRRRPLVVRPQDGWMPHKRVHQYRGGQPETFGGVTINIDRNWLDLGKGSVAPTEAKHCGGTVVYNYPSYANLQRGTTSDRPGAHAPVHAPGPRRLQGARSTGRTATPRSPRCARTGSRSAGRPRTTGRVTSGCS